MRAATAEKILWSLLYIHVLQGERSFEQKELTNLWHEANFPVQE